MGWGYTGQSPNILFDVNQDSGQARGLVAWWPLIASRNQNLARDMAGLGSTGDFPGGAADPTWEMDSAFGAVLNFDAASFQYVSVGSIFKPLDVNEPFSITLWMKQTTVSAWGLLSIETTGALAYEIFTHTALAYAPISFGSGVAAPGVNRQIRFTTDFSAALTVWNHIAVTFDGVDATAQASYKLYRNGQSEAISDSGTFGNIGNVTRLGRLGTSGFYLHGHLSDVRVYDRVLTPTEVFLQHAPDTRWELYRPRLLHLRAA